MGEGIALGRGALVIDALLKGTLVKPFPLALPSSYAYFVVTARVAAMDPVVRRVPGLVARGGQGYSARAGSDPDRMSETDGRVRLRYRHCRDLRRCCKRRAHRGGFRHCNRARYGAADDSGRCLRFAT